MTLLFYHPYCKPFYRHPFESIKYFFISLKWAYQRAKKGYCDRDLMLGVSNWFLEMIPEVVDEIKKEKTTVPLICYDEAIKSFGLNPEEYWITRDDDVYEISYAQIEAEAEKIWNAVLTRISFLLREAVWWTCTKTNPYEEEFHRVFEDRRNGVEVPGFDELEKQYDDERKKLEAYREQCKKEATELIWKWASYLEI